MINDKLLLDLEINEKVIPYTDSTITTSGKIKFKKLFTLSLSDSKSISRRREILDQMINKQKNTQKIIRELKRIKKYENSITWLFSKIGKEYKDLYFNKDFFNTPELLSTKNFLKIYTPSIVVIIYLLIYVFLRYNNIEIDLIQYITGIYQSYKMMVLGMLALFMENINMISFLTNLIVTLYVFYQIYSIYSSCDSSVSHYYKCSDFNDHIFNLRDFIDCAQNIYRLDNFFTYEKKSIWNELSNLDNVFDDNKLNKMGYKLTIKKNYIQYEELFDKVLQYIGTIDAYINISNLVSYKNYTFPTFDFNKKGAYINAQNIWSPYIIKNEQVTNDGYLGGNNPNTFVVTGPNTSGKSFYLRNMMLSVFLAQTLGVTCCDNLIFTPFNNFFTYLDIPNISRYRESLFEAEVMRCMEYCEIIKNMSKDEYVFTIMDELLTSTNPQESMATSFAFCEYIGKFKNAINIITTHYIELCDLETLHPLEFKNMKFEIVKNQDKSFYRSYKITEGVSNQHLAIELLKLKGYNNTIIDRAIERVKTQRIEPTS